jgi:hypothetical protein
VRRRRVLRQRCRVVGRGGGWGGGGAYGYGGAGYNPAAQDAAIFESNQTRRFLEIGLNLPYTQPNAFLRGLCGPCYNCQEVDAVLDFYRVNGWQIQYGSCLNCACSTLVDGYGNVIVPPSDWAQSMPANASWGSVGVPPEGGFYFHRGYLVPYDNGAPQLRNKSIKQRNEATPTTSMHPPVCRGSANPTVAVLPLLAMERA